MPDCPNCKAAWGTTRTTDRARIKAEAERDEALARLAQMRKAWEYFACPRCQCAWFRMYSHEKDELECKRCGWHGPRKDGESERFLSSTLDASAQEQKPAKPAKREEEKDG